MSEIAYSNAIKNLCQDYYRRNISLAEYRTHRKIVIDKMDEYYNAVDFPPQDEPEVDSASDNASPF